MESGREKCALNFEVKLNMLCSVCFGSFMQLFCFESFDYYLFIIKKETCLMFFTYYLKFYTMIKLLFGKKKSVNDPFQFIWSKGIGH